MTAAELAELAEARRHWAALGWRVFLSDRRRWWATTTRRPVGRYGAEFAPDAVDADTYAELAAKLEGKPR